VLDVTKYFRNPTKVVELDAGERLFSQGDSGDTMYAILEGEPEVQINGQTVDRVSTGRLLGETAIIESAPRRRTAWPARPCP
jgi:CRP-like cAMP-binding protein